MSDLFQIDIDIDVYKKIEISRKTFDESHNSILKRLLEANTAVGVSAPQFDKKSWSGKGVTLPHGTELEMTYNGVTHRGIVDDGRWKVRDEFYSSPSDAASGVSTLVTGKRKSLNGWVYWIAKTPNQPLWKKISDMRLLAEKS